jgi:CRP/FNR family transcriptional regulator
MAKFIKLRDCKRCKRKIELFDLFTEDELARINEDRYEVHFKAGETIFKQGTSLTHIICITSGLAKIYLEGYNNKNLIMSLAKPGELIGGPGIYTDQRHHFSVAAVEETTACFIDAKLFREIAENNKDVTGTMLSRSSERDIRYFDKLITLTQKQMPGRVADTILYLYRNVYNTNPFYLTINRLEMANLSSMTKESLIRILKDFKEANFITVQGNELKIINEKALINISETG